MAVESLCGKILGIFATLFMISLSGSQNLIFELKERQYQEVIFPGDVTVAMICEITDVTTAEVEITIDGKIAAKNSGQGNCLEFVISKIDDDDNMNLTCSVSYKPGGNTTPITVTKTLILNVSNIDHSCFRNGTGINQPYQMGDVLVLSCYCRETVPCKWTETEIGTGLGHVIEPTEIIHYNNKNILRIIVGPFYATTINTLRYDCSHGSSVGQRCSIGPGNSSDGDFVLNPTPASVMSLECPVREVFTSKPATSGEVKVEFSTSWGSHPSGELEVAFSTTGGSHSTYSTTEDSISSFPNAPSSTKSANGRLGLENNPTTDDMGGSNIALIIASAGVFVLLIVCALSIVLLFKARRYKKSKMTSTDDKEAEEVVTPNEKVDSHGYEGDKSDDALELYKNGDFTHCGIGVAHVVDNIDIDKTYGTEAQVPASQPLDNDLYANDGNYGNDGNDEDDDEMFQTADTSDYAVPVALMKNNMQGELAEAVALYAKVKRHVSMME